MLKAPLSGGLSAACFGGRYSPLLGLLPRLTSAPGLVKPVWVTSMTEPSSVNSGFLYSFFLSTVFSHPPPKQTQAAPSQLGLVTAHYT